MLLRSPLPHSRQIPENKSPVRSTRHRRPRPRRIRRDQVNERDGLDTLSLFVPRKRGDDFALC